MIATSQPCQQTEPSTQNDLRAYVSASRLNCWARCPLAFQFRYVEGIRTPPSPALFLGKRVHESLEFWYRHRQLGSPVSVEQVTERLSAQWDAAVTEEAMQFSDAATEAKLQQQAAALVQTYLQRHMDEESTPLAVEATVQTELIDPVTGERYGIDLLGVMDVIFADRPGAVIADFKTAASSTAPHPLQHEVQLTAYAYLYRESTGEQESALELRTLVKTKTPRSLTHRYQARNPQHFARFFALVREYLDALDSCRFNYRPGWHCVTCEYRDGPCHAWSG